MEPIRGSVNHYVFSRSSPAASAILTQPTLPSPEKLLVPAYTPSWGGRAASPSLATIGGAALAATSKFPAFGEPLVQPVQRGGERGGDAPVRGGRRGSRRQDDEEAKPRKLRSASTGEEGVSKRTSPASTPERKRNGSSSQQRWRRQQQSKQSKAELLLGSPLLALTPEQGRNARDLLIAARYPQRDVAAQHAEATIRTLELLQFWMTEDCGQSAIEQAISEALEAAGLSLDRRKSSLKAGHDSSRRGSRSRSKGSRKARSKVDGEAEIVPSSDEHAKRPENGVGSSDGSDLNRHILPELSPWEPPPAGSEPHVERRSSQPNAVDGNPSTATTTMDVMQCQPFVDDTSPTSSGGAESRKGGPSEAGDSQLSPVACVTPRLKDDSSPIVQWQPAVPVTPLAPRNSIGSMSSSIGLSQAPRTSLPRLSGASLSHKSPPTSPLSSSIGSFHVVDELDAAHARGALVIGNIHNGHLLNQDFTEHSPPCPLGPLSSGAAGPAHPAGRNQRHSSRPSGEWAEDFLLRPDDVVDLTAKNADRGGGVVPRRESESNTSLTIKSGVDEEDKGATTPLGVVSTQSIVTPTRGEGDKQRSCSSENTLSPLFHPMPGSGATPRKKGRRRQSPRKSQSGPKYATLEEIPRFYFPGGAKPEFGAEALEGPFSRAYQNPHLVVTDTITQPVAMFDASGSQLPAMPEDNPIIPIGSREVPVHPLATKEDSEVVAFITAEFSKLPPPPPLLQSLIKPQHPLQGKIRVGSSRAARFLGSATSTIANSTASKQEALFKQKMHLGMQRICTECFGLPKYFAPMLILLLGGGGDRELPTTPSGKPPATPVSSTVGGLFTSPPLQLSNITPQLVIKFYETHLRHKSILQRIFDALIVIGHSIYPAAAAKLVGNGPAAERTFLVRSDFAVYVEVLLEYHPGLLFLKQTVDFQSKYLDTVIYRIFYDLDRFDCGRITFAQFTNSRLPDAFRHVDATDDINSVLAYFSYEHFYVLYCHFWELDGDRDLQLTPQDLARYAPENVMNPLIIQRVFAGVGRRLTCPEKGKMNYEDFVWFCLSEEDKSSPSAITYWFRIVDLDGDGVLSIYEMEVFYEFTRAKIASFLPEGAIGFGDILCQIFDMFQCSPTQGITLGMMLNDPQAAFVALNMVTSVVKCVLFEQKDPFVAHQERLAGGLEQTEWDLFARAEYDRMSLEADGSGDFR